MYSTLRSDLPADPVPRLAFRYEACLGQGPMSALITLEAKRTPQLYRAVAHETEARNGCEWMASDLAQVLESDKDITVGQRGSTVNRVLAVHVADLGLIPGFSYVP